MAVIRGGAGIARLPTSSESWWIVSMPRTTVTKTVDTAIESGAKQTAVVAITKAIAKRTTSLLVLEEECKG